MEELFLETQNGRTRIDPAMVQKFNLKKGSRSPFLSGRIVGANGEYPDLEIQNKDDKLTKRKENLESENVMLTQSEIIDFSQGADSTTKQ